MKRREQSIEFGITAIKIYEQRTIFPVNQILAKERTRVCICHRRFALSARITVHQDTYTAREILFSCHFHHRLERNKKANILLRIEMGGESFGKDLVPKVQSTARQVNPSQLRAPRSYYTILYREFIYCTII